ncbi:MAG: LamG domain-containing protein [Pirellulales bacterium]|nr:LamG domain-containing protein [Pirellulales bacterium]
MKNYDKFLALGLSTILLASSFAGENPKLSDGLIGHWKLQGDCQDYSGKGNHGAGRNVSFADGPDGSARGAASFNGRDGWIEVPDNASLHLGTKDFSIGVWVKPEATMTNVFGDILSKFDGAKRRGINFHIAGSASGYSSMCDTRHVHFGIDDGYLSDWTDCGKPDPTNALITSLVVFEGQLYAGIAGADDPQNACRVYRWEGNGKWIDCGRLGNDPNHLTVQSLYVHRGKLYAGTGIWSRRRAWGAQRGKGFAPAAKPRVFVYEGGTKWRDLGQVGESTRVMCMASFNGELYLGLDKLGRNNAVPGKCFRYTGAGWIDCGSPDGENFENLLPFGGTLYGATHGSIFKYEGGKKWTCIGKMPFGVSQIHSIDAYRGLMYIGTWPQGYALRYDGGEKWAIDGRLGAPFKEGEREVNEINDLTVHNGKLYAGAIPHAEVYRYEDNAKWTLLKSLAHNTPYDSTIADTWYRVTVMASYRGILYAGTGSVYGMSEDRDPDGTLGRVYSIRAGQVVSHERDIGGGWTHLAAVRKGKALRLYVNGELSASCTASEDRIFDLTNAEPLKIGFGAQNYFTGAMSDLRLYGRALEADEVRQIREISSLHR